MRILIVFGTRPEAIKMAPLVSEFKKHESVFDVKVCVTGQHRHMLDQVLNFFGITPDFDLDLMKPNQNLYQLTSDVLLGLKPVYEEFKPDYVFVHGDTTTSMAASLGAFYAHAHICHVEAGLRTHNKYSPFPEEINRQLTGKLADIHFAPTASAKENLIAESISESSIVVTGNTVIDALFLAKDKVEEIVDPEIELLKQLVNPEKKLVLVTGHRRENFGQGFINICSALSRLASREDVQIVYPVHLNPNVKNTVHSYLGEHANINLIEPISYPAFVWLMKRAHLILTDSGGVQEEAPSLGIPVLVMRDTTERPEAITAGTVLLVGTDENEIVSKADLLLDDKDEYLAMSNAHNPYGDGHACSHIVTHLLNITR
jgi:UDP-N-acetylglucosamine 2-epimerase (non-hydrolysing)